MDSDISDEFLLKVFIIVLIFLLMNNDYIKKKYLSIQICASLLLFGLLPGKPFEKWEFGFREIFGKVGRGHQSLNSTGMGNMGNVAGVTGVGERQTR